MKRFMMKTYSILKHEDIFPYIDDTMMIICDGLGGSGSMMHVFNKKTMTIENIQSFLWSKTLQSELDDYERKMIQELTDDHDHTSAYLASRIVGLNLKRYLALEKTIDPNELTSLLIDQLHQVSDKLELDKTMSFGQVLLPTTLMAYRFTEDDQNLYVDTLYAGDSRGYVINNNHFFQLSKDDEDASGALTNLIYAAPSDHHLNVHHKTYTLIKPSILIGVSDGGFDPFEPYSHHGLAYALYKIMLESSDIKDFEKRYKDYFDQIRQDDTTIGFISFGYETFDDVKDALLASLKHYHDNYETYITHRHYFPLLDLDKTSIVSYVIQRTTDKKQAIIKKLIDDIFSKEANLFNTGAFYDALNTLKTDFIHEKKKKLHETFKHDIYNLLHTLDVLTEEVINPHSKKYHTLALKHSNIKETYHSMLAREDAFKLAHDALITSLNDWQSRLLSSLTDTKFAKKTKKMMEIYHEPKDLIAIWVKHYTSLHDDDVKVFYQHFYQEALTMIEAQNKERLLQEACIEEHMNIDQAMTEFILEVKDVIKTSDDIQDLLHPVLLSNYGIVYNHDDINVHQGDIETLIFNHFKDGETLFQAWLDALLLAEKPTAYDLYFNLTKLQQAKWFMKHENQDLLALKTLRQTLYAEEDMIESYAKRGEDHA